MRAYGGEGEYPGGPSPEPTCPFCLRCSRREFEECGPAVPVMRFEPLNPVTPGHMLFVPFTHVRNASEHPTLTGLVFQAAARWGKEQNREYNLITSAGPNATQSVWHLHVHYVPRAMDDGLYLPWTGQVK